ncbi:hypothetical protein BCON_0536g00080 [Botryotinia convoluta]|uniref:Uncharacterized protein n=1 Tax=Botryotinia convoluta TaxID=54673 RepID=A0A4Z1HA55_9HELO|nr:hypothetical protein BCON_0536g00080 [Botryotinia convoluta]
MSRQVSRVESLQFYETLPDNDNCAFEKSHSSQQDKEMENMGLFEKDSQKLRFEGTAFANMIELTITS